MDSHSPKRKAYIPKREDLENTLKIGTLISQLLEAYRNPEHINKSPLLQVRALCQTGVKPPLISLFQKSYLQCKNKKAKATL